MIPTSKNDTIAALATNPNRGGIGVIRISGPYSAQILQLLAPTIPDPPASHRLHLTTLRDNLGQAIDEGFVVLMKAPRSYTCEDVVELHVHGGEANLARVLRTVYGFGARPAEPGEFTLRAFLAGRIDLTQAEAVMDMVTAPTEGALNQAFTQLRGGLAERVLTLRDRALTILSRLEVQIDFIDEDLGGVHGERPTELLRNLQQQVLSLANTWHTGSKLRHGARVVLVGPPNAGKSSLFNALLKKSRAIVTPIPGTTRDYLEEPAEFAGIPVVLIDTAGLRDDTDDVVEQAGIERTSTLAKLADVVLVLTPSGAEASPVPAQIPSECVLRVTTKSDLGDGDVSAVTGDGLEPLIDRIVQRLISGTDLKDTDVMITHERHYTALSAADAALSNAYTACAAGEPVDAIAVDVQEAVYQLGLVVGETTTDDLLDRIFGEFCIGK